MKRLLLMAFAFGMITLVSCNRHKSKLNSAITQYAKAYIVDSGENLDVIDIIKVDTITPQRKCEIASEIYNYRQDYVLEAINREIEYSDKRLKSVNEMLSILTISYLRRNYEDEANEMSNAIDSLKDELLYISRLKVNYRDSCKTLDSSTFLDYYVKVLIQTSLHQKITKRDTFQVIVTPDYKIIDKETYTNESFF